MDWSGKLNDGGLFGERQTLGLQHHKLTRESLLPTVSFSGKPWHLS
jgi:hypothetical protein